LKLRQSLLGHQQRLISQVLQQHEVMPIAVDELQPTNEYTRLAMQVGS
jgi:hypothetical protein